MTTTPPPGSDNVHGPAPRPCASCPYRRDVPSGVWAASEYDKLIAYDADTPLQPPNLFLCHQTSAEDSARRVCAGWLGCHGDSLLAVRLAAAYGALAEGDLAAAFNYRTDVALFESGASAAAHGRRDIDDPDDRARGAIAKISRRRGDLTT